MSHFKFFWGVIAAGFLAAIAYPLPTDAATKARVAANYGKLPLIFEANRGQTDARVKFLSRGRGYSLFLTESEAVLSLHGAEGKGRVLRVKLLGAEAKPKMTGLARLPGNSNYFIGRDRSKWRTGVPHYAKVGYEGVYPGIDLVFYGTNQRQLEYDFVVAPGADPARIRLAIEGAKRLEIDGSGDLVAHLPGGEVRFKKPVIYQEADGAKRPVAGGYVLKDGRVTFKVAAYDRTKPLVIDPVLVYSTYLGGTNVEVGWGLAVDADGSAYVSGDTRSANFPVTSGAAQEVHAGGTQDVFVTKFTPDGSDIVYSTYLGGSGQDFGRGGIAVDGAGHAYVVAETRSTDDPATVDVDEGFPTTPGAFREVGRGPVVVKLLPDGSDIAYSTLLGGLSPSFNPYSASGVAVRPGCPDAIRDPCLIYVTGNVTGAGPIETTDDAFKVEIGAEERDPFLSVINPLGLGDADLFYGTHFGGGEGVSESASAIAVDAEGKAYVAGSTVAHDFPATPGAFQEFCGDELDVSDCRGRDVAVTQTAISFDAGQIVEHLIIRFVPADGAEEGTEAYNIDLTGGPVSLSADGADSSAEGLIIDAQGPLTAYVSNGVPVIDATGIEGETATFFIGLNRPASQNVTVSYRTVDGTAKAPGDYTAASGSVTFEVNENTEVTNIVRAVTIQTIDDGEDEAVYETFFLDITSVVPSAAVQILPELSSAEARIFDDDGSDGEPFVVAISDSAVLEGDNASFEVRLNRPAPKNMTISFDLVHKTTSPGTGNGEAFVAKFDPFIVKDDLTETKTGADTLVYATFIGGHGGDGASGIIVDSLGRAHLTGSTTSSDDPDTTTVDEGFPITANAFASNLRGTQDAIVTILDENGSSLVYSTYLGGDSTDSGWGIALGPNGLVYVTGTTRSADDPDTPADEGFPTTPDAIQPQNAGRSDVFAVVFAVVFDPADENADPLVDLEFSTYLGGSGDEDRGLAIAADGMDGIYLAGTTFSGNFTTTPGAFQEEDGTAACVGLRGMKRLACISDSSVWDAFAAKIALDPPPPSDGQEVAITAFDTTGRVRLGLRQCLNTCTKSVTFSIANLGGVPADVTFSVTSDTPDGVTFSGCDGFATFVGGTSKDFGCQVRYEVDREIFIFTAPVTITLTIDPLPPFIDADPSNNTRSITVKVSDTRK